MYSILYYECIKLCNKIKYKFYRWFIKDEINNYLNKDIINIVLDNTDLIEIIK